MKLSTSLIIIVIFVAGLVLVLKVPSATNIPDVFLEEETDEVVEEEDVQNTNNLEEIMTNENQNGEQISLEGDLMMQVVKEGQGDMITDGQMASVHYVGTFTDGTSFDSSRERGTPFDFTVGAGQVIKGWDVGVKGMKVGEIRNLTIPSSYGYGDSAVGPIPGGSTLLFEVELLEIK